MGEVGASEVIAVLDIGGTNTRVGLVCDGCLVGMQRFLTKSSVGADALVEIIGKVLIETLKNVGIKRRELTAIGVAVPGPIDIVRGAVRKPANLGWADYPLRENLEQMFPGAFVVIEDDARCAALGEAQYGAGRDFGKVWYATVSTGIGGGLVVDGRPFRGAHLSAGEWGHMTVAADGPPCLCGKRGCLEAIASGPAILAAVRARLPGRFEGVDWTTESVFDEFRRGGRVAVDVIHQATDALARGLAAVMQIVDPDVMVLGGGVIEHQGDVLLASLEARVKQYVLPTSRSFVNVVKSSLGDNAGAWGAYAMVRLSLDAGIRG